MINHVILIVMDSVGVGYLPDKEIKNGVNLGIRQTFADCGQTIADIIGAGKLAYGKSFKKDLMHG